MVHMPDTVEAEVAKNRLALITDQDVVLQTWSAPIVKWEPCTYRMYAAVNYWRVLRMKVGETVSCTLKLN